MEKNKGKIIVVECLSSSASYIGDIRRMGYEPVLMELPVADSQRDDMRRIHDYYYTLNGDEIPQIVTGGDTYEKTLQIAKELHPAFILPGSDDGLIAATRLAHDLGLPGNAPSRLDVMRKKDVQQEALRKAGLRSIRGRIVSSVDEALDFLRETKNGKVVIKPEMGGASNGVRICKNKEEIVQALQYNDEMIRNDPGRFLRVLIQEYIEGEEYTVDAVFCGAEPYETMITKYTKKLVNDTEKIYDTAQFMDLHDPELKELREYAMGVNRALGLTHGVTHNEYMIDEKGPVLIEANCRPYGAMVKSSYLDKVLGFHETLLSLRSYIEPEKLAAEIGSLPVLQAMGMIKVLIIYEDIYVKNVLFEETAKGFKTCQYYMDAGNDRLYGKTIDLSTCGGIFYLAGKPEDVEADVNLLRRIERDHPEKLFEMTGIPAAKSLDE